MIWGGSVAKIFTSAEVRPNTTVYSQFRGVHLTDPYLCDVNHSPYALNLISNNEGLPEIRPGWRVLHTLEQPVNGMARGIVNGTEVFLAHCGTKLYQWTDTTCTEITSGLGNSKSTLFFAMHDSKAKAWILMGSDYLVYDGTSVKRVEEIATVPVILIAKKPSGGGSLYSPVNLLQKKRTEKFAGDGASKVYQLAANNLDSTAVTVTEVTASGETTRTDVTVNTATGQVMFLSAPPTPPVSGTDNIFITYEKTVSGYAERINNCTVYTEYGETGAGRIFVTKNPAYRNYDWWSELSDPTYFPDLNFGVTGNPSTAIMGYSKLGRYQVLIKEDNQQDTTIFLRYPSTLADGTPYFKLEAGVAGTGAIAAASFVSLVDEPLFLSRTGIYAITSNNITAERTLQNRSYYVDEQLTKEPNLQNAIATEWNGYYLLALNGKVYAFHSRSKEAHGLSFVYNCFVWNNISAVCFMTNKGELYFGDGAGRICKFNSDLSGGDQYHDHFEAIHVIWTTKMDNDGIPFMRKTMQKKGSGITTKPFARSTYEIAVVTEKSESDQMIQRFHRDIFDLNDFDLTRLSLESSPYAKFTPFKKKIKKYESMQMVVRASAMNEGFGIYNIIKQWVPVDYVKR